jgi:3-oxosteroid 1-dehydrogenase
MSASSVSNDCDVLIVGSGCAALVAALKAAQGGMRVIVIEKTAKLGGTSAMSGAGMWVPANPVMVTAGLDDSPADALDYLRAVAPEGWRETEDRHWKSMVDAGPEMISFLEAHSPLRFAMTAERDPYGHEKGAKAQGRMISPLPLSRWRLGKLAFKLRRSTLPEIFTYHEAVSKDLFHHPVRTILSLLPRLTWRFLLNAAGRGQALMIGLIRGCLDKGVEFRLESPAIELIREEGRITEVKVGGPNPCSIRVREAVVIASGGFEWDMQMRAAHFPGANSYNASSPGNSGDGHKIAAAIGAKFARMGEANLHPCLPTRYEGAIQGAPLPYHTEPNAIIVDRNGRRFVNEQAFNLGVALNRCDPQTGMPLHLPAWVISDADYLPRLPIARWYLRSRPSDLVRAETIEELAAKIGLPGEALVETVRRFNEDYLKGKDSLFGRSNAVHGPEDRRKRAGIEPIRKPSFVAVHIGRAFLGTKGGLATDERGRVLDRDDTIIHGLFAAGAAAASSIGTKAVGAGTTIGPYMSFGYVCADEILAQRARPPVSDNIDPRRPIHTLTAMPR